MKRSRMLLLALLSALLFSIPFFQWGTGLLLMVAFVPLLFIEDEIASTGLCRSGIRGLRSRRRSRNRRNLFPCEILRKENELNEECGNDC